MSILQDSYVKLKTFTRSVDAFHLLILRKVLVCSVQCCWKKCWKKSYYTIIQYFSYLVQYQTRLQNWMYP